MTSKEIEAEIDRLYQLPLDEFTAARNALAKRAGADGARVRALAKPPVAAWAVNQLYWKQRDAWQALIDAAEEARRVNKAVLSGRSGDVRAAGKAHDEAVEAALKTTLDAATGTGHPATDATRQAVLNTLRALPSDAAPGRLTQALQPGGFEILAALGVKGGHAPKTSATHAPAARPTAETGPAKRDTKAVLKAREAAASAERSVTSAEQALRRAEFESARTAREQKRAAEKLERAQEALSKAEAEAERAEREHAAAVRHSEAAEAHTREAKDALTAARDRAHDTAERLRQLERD
jgi:hypothetical protein